MKEFIIKPAVLTRIELWAASTIFVFAVFFLITSMTGTNIELFSRAGIAYDHYENFFFPTLVRYIVLFLTFLLLSFRVVPAIVDRRNLTLNIGVIVVVLLAVWMVFGIADTYLKAYQFKQFNTDERFYSHVFAKSFVNAVWVMLMFGIYSVVKYASVYLLSNSETISTRFRIITRDSLIAFVLWMISMFILLIGDAEGEIVIIWGILVPFAIFFYCYSCYSLIPSAYQRKKPFRSYILRSLLVMIAAFLPVAFIILLITNDDETAFAASFFMGTFHLFITAPITWAIFKRRMQGNEEIFVLQKELKRSNANLDFLRSQINPHFLFNALNTIYATALNEKAECTGEAIQKLGDMMRFMLHENMQEKIPLVREIEYLENYIGLQKLRTDHNPNLKIDTNIEASTELVSIAPMLLIPFVENAFKHGISFRESSQIRTALEVRNKTLYFDVYNSKHEKPDNDPEKDKSGIGLNNVKQRLQLLYPSKHELIIRETQKEYFIHLTIQLS